MYYEARGTDTSKSLWSYAPQNFCTAKNAALLFAFIFPACVFFPSLAYRPALASQDCSPATTLDRLRRLVRLAALR
jgi:hypothetical protein